MPGLLDLPREIRDAILTLAIPWQQDRPTSLDDLNVENRHELPICAGDAGFGTMFVQFEKRPRWHTISSLSLTNKQLYLEVLDYIHDISKSPLNYELDLIYVAGRGTFSTWTYIPMLSNTVDTVYVTMRVMGREGEAGDIFGRSRVLLFMRGEGAPDAHAWMFLHILQTFLAHGPWPKTFDATLDEEKQYRWYRGKRETSDFSLQRLIIDALPTPTGDEPTYPSKYQENGDSLAAQSLASFIQDCLCLLVDLPIPEVYKFASSLCGQTNICEIRSNGSHVQTRYFPGLRFSYDQSEVMRTGEYGKSYSEAIVSTAEKRLQVGLPVIPLFDWQKGMLQSFELEEKYEGIIQSTKARPRRIFIHYENREENKQVA